MHSTDFKIAMAQVTIFTPSEDAFDRNQFLGAILAHYAARFDGQMTLPDEIKVQAPGLKLDTSSVVMTSKDGAWNLAATPQRVTSVWKHTPETQDDFQKKPLQDVANDCLRPILKYVVTQKVQVGRLSLVVDRWCQSAEKPAITISKRYCRDEHLTTGAPLSNSLDFQIHNRKQFRCDPIDLNVNSWVRMASGLRGNAPCVNFFQDINTLGEEIDKHSFTKQQMIDYFNCTSSEADKILDLYFPPLEASK